ncbi:MAG: glycosyltransferase [Ruminococcus sp.]|nr:glycosyltransferase [Ruminococcus sp.]
MKKIRVLHFQLDSHLGGIEMFLSNLMSEIDREKVQFEFVTSVDHPALEKRFFELGAVIHHVPSPKSYIAYKKSIGDLIKADFDIVHFHKNSAANIIPIIEAKKRGKRIIVHSHNTSPSVGGISYFFHKVNKSKLNDLADRKLACSTEAGKWMFDSDTFEVMTNGIITERFRYDLERRQTIRAEFGIDSDCFLYGNIGRFTEQKNHARLISLFREIKSLRENSALVLVGDGELRNAVEKQVQDAGLSNSVFFTGVRSDIPDLLMAMDAFVMPSLYEGLPIVAVEAQAAGLHLFLANTISPETDIIHQTTWFSLKDSDKELANIICNSNFENSRAAMATAICEAGYDIQKTANRLLEIYMGMIG